MTSFVTPKTQNAISSPRSCLVESAQTHELRSPRPVVPMPIGKGRKRLSTPPMNPTSVKRVAFDSPSITPIVIASRRLRIRCSGRHVRRFRRRYTAQLASPVLASSLLTDPLPLAQMDATEANTSSVSPDYLFDWRLTRQDDSFNFGRRDQVQSQNGEVEMCSQF